jgi:hypothetical protein
MTEEEIRAGAPCPLCEAPLAEKALRDVVGDEAPLRLTLRNLPVLACDAPHRYFPGHGFPVWLLNSLVEEEQKKIPAGAEKGLVFRKYACCDCGGEIPSSGGEPMTFSSTLDWQKTAPFVVDITVPVVCCPTCGREQARSRAELEKLLPAALVHAFKTAGLKGPR